MKAVYEDSLNYVLVRVRMKKSFGFVIILINGKFSDLQIALLPQPYFIRKPDVVVHAYVPSY